MIRALLVLLVAGCSNSDIRITFAGTGGGVVRSNGRMCTKDCTLPFGALTAEPDRFSQFAGWTGGDCHANGECLPRGESGVTATFDAVAWPVSVTISGEGRVAAGGQEFTSSFVFGVDVGKSVRFDATPGTGWLLARWEAICEPGSTPTSCVITPSGPLQLSVVFEKGVPYTVIVDGSGVVEGPDGLGTCNSTCRDVARTNSRVTLFARAAAGMTLAEWSNECGSRNPCEFTATESVSITARFRPAVTLKALGDGTGVLRGPGVQRCTSFPCDVPWLGQAISFEVAANEDSRFLGFTGCPRASSQTCTIDRYVAEVDISLQRVVLSAEELIGELRSSPKGGLRGGVAHAWLNHQSRIQFGTNFADGDGASLVVMSDGGDRFVADVPADSVVSTASLPDAGSVALFAATASFQLGATQFDGGEQAVVALTGAGAVEWTYRFQDGVVLRNVEVDRETGAVWVTGVLDPGALELTVGSSTIQPYASSPGDPTFPTAFLAAFSAGGQPLWVKVVAAGPAPIVSVVQGPFGPATVTLAEMYGNGSSACSSRVEATPSPAVELHLRDGGCSAELPDVYLDTLAQVSTVAAYEFHAGAALEQDVLLASSTERDLCQVANPPPPLSQRWTLSRHGRVYGGLTHECTVVHCGDVAKFSIRALSHTQTDTIVIGDGECVLDVAPSPGLRRSFTAHWDLAQRKFTSAWQLRVESETLSAMSDGAEVVMWVRVMSPLDLNGRHFAASPANPVVLRLRVRP